MLVELAGLFPGLDPRTLDEHDPTDVDFVRRAFATASIRQRVGNDDKKPKVNLREKPPI